MMFALSAAGERTHKHSASVGKAAKCSMDPVGGEATSAPTHPHADPAIS